MSIVTCRSHASRGVTSVFRGETDEALFHYIGGSTGPWRIAKMVTLSGASLKLASHLSIVQGRIGRSPARSSWVLRGFARNTRFFTREERFSLDSPQLASNRMEATCASLIPIRKSAEWWNLAVEERQEIIDSRSRQITRGLKLIPAIARRLLYGRDLGEPFDVVTWFEYGPKDANIFDDLAGALRASIEWQYVEREIDIRLIRDV